MTDTTLTTPSSSTAGSPYQTRAYAMSGLNGVMTNAYVSGAPLTAFNWVKDPAVGAVWAQSGLTGAIPTWQAASTWHANITFRGACRGYFVKEAELRAALLAISDNVIGRVLRLEPSAGGWTTTPVDMPRAP